MERAREHRERSGNSPKTVFHTVENLAGFFPYCGKNAKKFSILWKKWPDFSTLWKKVFHSVEKFPLPVHRSIFIVHRFP